MTVSATNWATDQMNEPSLQILPCGSNTDLALAQTLAHLEAICFSQPWSESSYRFILSSPYHRLILLKKEDRIIGWAVLFLIFEEGELQNIAVLPEERGKGYGDRLLKAAIKEIKAGGGESLRLEVREGNIPARKLYLKNGFSEEGKRKKYYKNPIEDAILMTAIL